MKAFLLISLLCTLALGQQLQECQHPNVDMITELLPNYTGTIQPCSFSGFAPLDDTNNSALFYWFFPNTTANPNGEAPIVVFLGGGPGAASISSIFSENGPFRIVTNPDGGSSINYAEDSWISHYNVLWLDNPVGAGYSYTDNSDGKHDYPHNEDEVAHAIWTAFQWFIKIHDEAANAKWYISGESYAGRYVPATAYWILNLNEQIAEGKLEGHSIDLQGILVGDGFVHGVSQRLAQIDAAQTAAIYSPIQYKQAKTLGVKCQNSYATNDPNAYLICNNLFVYPANISGIDLMAMNMPAVMTANLTPGLDDYLNDPQTVAILHANTTKKTGKPYLGFSTDAYNALSGEILNSSIVYIDYLLPKIPCLFYEGNFDGRDGSYSAYAWFKLLKSPYDIMVNVTRNIWFNTEGNPVGFWSVYQNFYHIIIDFAGHFPPYFKLSVTNLMLDIFTGNKNWDPYNNGTNISQTLCSYMNNCSDHGHCDDRGLCVCDQGYFLGDCSVKPEDLEQDQTYTLAPRGYAFFRLPANGNDQFVTFKGDSGALKVLYVGSSKGPAVDYEYADAILTPNPSSTDARSIFLAATGQPFGYLTIQNTDYNKPAKFDVIIYTEADGYFVAQMSKVSFVAAMFVLSLVILLIAGAILLCYKKGLFDQKDYNRLTEESMKLND